MWTHNFINDKDVEIKIIYLVIYSDLSSLHVPFLNLSVLVSVWWPNITNCLNKWLQIPLKKNIHNKIKSFTDYFSWGTTDQYILISDIKYLQILKLYFAIIIRICYNNKLIAQHPLNLCKRKRFTDWSASVFCYFFLPLTIILVANILKPNIFPTSSRWNVHCNSCLVFK